MITSGLAVHYKRLEHRREVEAIIDERRKAGLFLSREAMIDYLLEMYDRASTGDVIWAQCVRCTDFTDKVRGKILEAAGRGVHFCMVINGHSPAVDEFRALFDPIDSAAIYESADNAISLQGLSDQEIVIAVPSVESYTAILVRNSYFVQIMRRWFEARIDVLECSSG